MEEFGIAMAKRKQLDGTDFDLWCFESAAKRGKAGSAPSSPSIPSVSSSSPVSSSSSSSSSSVSSSPSPSSSSSYSSSSPPPPPPPNRWVLKNGGIYHCVINNDTTLVVSEARFNKLSGLFKKHSRHGSAQDFQAALQVFSSFVLLIISSVCSLGSCLGLCTTFKGLSSCDSE